MQYVNNPKLKHCAKTILRGGVVAYPTEAVWGLGADPFNQKAVESILRLKNRSWSKGLILISATRSDFDFLLPNMNDDKNFLLDSTWPGPNTWLIPHNNLIPPWVCGRFETVACRVTQHPLVAALCEQVGGPIVSTSANPQAKQPARTQFQARRYFGKSGIEFTPGVVGASKSPSTIRDLSTGTVIR